MLTNIRTVIGALLMESALLVMPKSVSLGLMEDIQEMLNMRDERRLMDEAFLQQVARENKEHGHA